MHFSTLFITAVLTGLTVAAPTPESTSPNLAAREPVGWWHLELFTSTHCVSGSVTSSEIDSRRVECENFPQFSVDIRAAHATYEDSDNWGTPCGWKVVVYEDRDCGGFSETIWNDQCRQAPIHVEGRVWRSFSVGYSTGSFCQ